MFLSATIYQYTPISEKQAILYSWLDKPILGYAVLKTTRQITIQNNDPINIKSTIYQPTPNNSLGIEKYSLTVGSNSKVKNYISADNNNYINEDGTIDRDSLIQALNLDTDLTSTTNTGNIPIIQLTRPQEEGSTILYYTYILIPVIDTSTESLQNFLVSHSITKGEYNCLIQLNDINFPSNQIATPEAILRMKVTPDTNFKLHPQKLYKATYISSAENTKTTLSITLPKLNYLIKTQDDTNILKYQNLKLLLIPENTNISKDDDPQTISPSKIQDCLESQNPNQNPICYLSTTTFTPDLFDPQKLECHLITFNQNIPAGTYKAVILQPENNTYKLFEMLPDRADLLPKITITSHYTTPQTTITPSTINTATMKLDTLQKGKITITINSDHFTGKTLENGDNQPKLRRWIEIMKGTEIILPKTEITTTYDENNQKITEVKEDYENNKITITIPEYYLFGYTEKPQQMPQNLTQNTSYTIQVYTTHYASTDTTHKQINLINMPFNLTFYHQDHLSTTRYITNDSGEILHTTDTLAYGEELTAPYENNKDEVLNTITYTGHEKDYETDLTYMLARYYSSETGRFLSPDPGYDYDQLDPMSWNLYAYVRGNPINHFDPTGLELSTEEKKRLEELYKQGEFKELDKEIRSILQDRMDKYNEWNAEYSGQEDFNSTVIDLKVNGYLKHVDWSKVDTSIKKLMIGPLAKKTINPPANYGKTREGSETGERVCNNIQTYVATPLTFSGSPVFEGIGQGIYFVAGWGKMHYAEAKYKLDPTEKNKKNLEMTRVQLGVASINFLGGWSLSFTIPNNDGTFNKVVNVLSTIVDSAFSYAEDQNNDN
ncbi:hypothetical protein TTHT_1183 [Thermotomaculum hydrothermale]|uniref:YD repeat protein n=1 Tax=Thermotomaculum hydrothermale TaxID=981385 RepID=A0A7R6PZM5_9BACT|nr:RHS repeat-associated core domain-containing protein [Thermotomaculum hydrothermale]BBB32713.1 hypothetical protein TTHT_1183 [Thermotomaculum hydrothermale]